MFIGGRGLHPRQPSACRERKSAPGKSRLAKGMDTREAERPFYACYLILRVRPGIPKLACLQRPSACFVRGSAQLAEPHVALAAVVNDNFRPERAVGQHSDARAQGDGRVSHGGEPVGVRHG